MIHNTSLVRPNMKNLAGATELQGHPKKKGKSAFFFDPQKKGKLKKPKKKKRQIDHSEGDQ